MKVIIAGSRDGVAFEDVVHGVMKFEQLHGKITEVVSGRARGADLIGEEYAAIHGLKVKMFPAEWDRFGKKAGSIRNAQMGDYADGLVAVWVGGSRGTWNMIQYARSKGMDGIVVTKDHGGAVRHVYSL
jgi:hypothetical protein